MRALLSGVIAAASITACLADLPPPAECPSPAKNPSIACEAQLAQSQAGGCVPQNDPSVGPCCACSADACPASASACFPDGDCPHAVTDRTHVASTCLRLAPEGFSGCACGCPRCMSICDGAGPTIATRVPNGSSLPVVPVQLPQPMASSGRLGVYVRVRGHGGLVLDVAGGVFGGKGDFMGGVASTSDTEFNDAVVWEPTWPAWRSAAEAPTALVFGAAPGETILEIDCVVPFVVAP
jgi:hypothetical protein